MAPDQHALDVAALLERTRRLAERHWRGLVWLTGDARDCRRRARALWFARSGLAGSGHAGLGQTGEWQAPLWIASHRPDELAEGLLDGQWLPPAKARIRLGGEHDLLVIDALPPREGLDPDALGALAGTLRAGGLLVLLTPADWGASPDADYARLAEHPWEPGRLSARYLARLARLLAAAPVVIPWPAGGHPRLPELPASPPAASAGGEDPDCLTRDQAEAVARLTRLKRRRPLVFTADRGRGKSAALGIACARLLARGEREILVTAPRPAAVAPLFERLAALCLQRQGPQGQGPDGRRQGMAFHWGEGVVRFVAPDELSDLARQGGAGGAGSLLLVDEAAAIPAALLGDWLEAFPRIAFATTVHGYEGSGRGFALRFRARLERRAPDYQACHLETPIRWAPDDPLEPLIHRLLLLDAEPGAGAPAEPRLRRWSRDALAEDEASLRALFGLLVQAHYRTTPGDLRRLLDAPGVGIATLESGGDIGGVLLTADEGGFEAGLAERVARGERRPRGHLMAQSLAAHAGSREALTGRLRRVLRIAVHPACRRQGLGRRLIEAERERGRADGLDLLGASFGAEPELIAFWQSLGFRAVRLGLTRETATGEHALMVVAPLSERGEALARDLRLRFQRALPGLLAFELQALEPRIAAALLAEGEAPTLKAGLSEDDRRDIADVAHGRREPALARPALRALARRALAAGVAVEDDDLQLLVAWAFQGAQPGSARIGAWHGVSGRREATRRLRRAVARLSEGLVNPSCLE